MCVFLFCFCKTKFVVEDSENEDLLCLIQLEVGFFFLKK